MRQEEDGGDGICWRPARHSCDVAWIGCGRRQMLVGEFVFYNNFVQMFQKLCLAAERVQLTGLRYQVFLD